MTDFMTLLTCNAPNTIATKTFIKQSDGTVIKKGYNAGMLFKHSEEPIKLTQPPKVGPYYKLVFGLLL
jgi:hypothetical protein